jgi:hypothetical protein
VECAIGNSTVLRGASLIIGPVNRARDDAGSWNRGAREQGRQPVGYATLDFALAAFFLLWTRVLVAWSYGEEREITKDEEAGVEKGTFG